MSPLSGANPPKAPKTPLSDKPWAPPQVPGQVQVCIMSISLHVSLLSGRTVQIETGLDVDVWEFNRRAQRALSVGRGRLVHPGGSVLDEAKTIRDNELCNDDFLSLHIQPTKIRAT